MRYDQWKIVFAEQKAHGVSVWRQPFTTARAPKIFNLRTDPFEVGDVEAMDWNRWWVEHIFLLVPAQQYVGRSRPARTAARSRWTQCWSRYKRQRARATDSTTADRRVAQAEVSRRLLNQ